MAEQIELVNKSAVKKHPKSEINKNMITSTGSVYAAKAALQRGEDVIGCQPAAKPVSRYAIKFLFFESCKKTLHTGIVVAVSSTAQALYQTGFRKLAAESIACILTASVAVQDSSVESAILLTKLFNSIYAKFLFHVITHFESYDLAVVAVEDRRNIKLSVSALNFGDIRQELRKRLVSAEITLYQIFFFLSFSISFCDPMRSAALMYKPGFAHCAVNRSEAYLRTLMRQSSLHSFHTVVIIILMFRQNALYFDQNKLPCTGFILISEPAIIA